MYFCALIADVAQLVEQLICNQRVGGSSPFIGSIESLYVRKRIREQEVLEAIFKGDFFTSELSCFLTEEL